MSERPSMEYATPSARRVAPVGVAIGQVACAIGMVAIAGPLLSLFPMLTVAPGTEIRPMGQAMFMVLGIAAGALLVLPMSVVAIVVAWRRREPQRWPLLALAAAVASIALVPAVFVLLLRTRDLALAD